MASSYIYRVSGEDGPPQDPSSPYNLSPTYNGWHEMFRYWRQVMTSRADLGRWLRHWFESGYPMPGQGDHLVAQRLGRSAEGVERAQASAAQLESAKLLFQAELAQDTFSFARSIPGGPAYPHCAILSGFRKPDPGPL